MAKDDDYTKNALTVINPFVVSEVPHVDKALNEQVNKAVDKILTADIRIDKEPEVISALRDYIMVEVALMKVYEKIVLGEADGADERVFRACLNAKSHLRDEIWGKVRGIKKKEQFTDAVHEILVDQKVIPKVPKKVKDEGDKDKD